MAVTVGRRALGLGTMALALLGAYAWLTQGISGTGHSSSTVAVADQAGSNSSVGDVPDSVVQAVTQSLSGLNAVDELYVSPSSLPNAYKVSATIRIDNGGFSEETSVIDQDSLAFFHGVFHAGVPIADAQIYFLNGGQLVAGADLGKNAYNALAVSTSTNPSAFVQAIQQMPEQTNTPSSNRWLEVQSANASVDNHS